MPHRHHRSGPGSGVAACLTAALALLAWPSRAAALGEDEWQLSLGAGYAVPTGGEAGPLGRLEGHLGLTDLLALRLSLGLAFRQGLEGDAVVDVRDASVSAGVVYAYDVLRVVPFVEGALVLVASDGPGPGRQDLGGELGVGAEYWLDRRWAVGLTGRFHYLALPLGGPDGPPQAGRGAWSFALRLGRVFF